MKLQELKHAAPTLLIPVQPHKIRFNTYVRSTGYVKL